MNISGSTRVFLILGDPVSQVKAPQAFNHLFREHGVDAVLVPAHVSPADFAGFATQALKARALDHWAIPIEGRRILVVGVGGAGVAIAASLAARRAGCVALSARNPGPAIEVAASLRERFRCEVVSVATPDPAGYDLVINATFAPKAAAAGTAPFRSRPAPAAR